MITVLIRTVIIYFLIIISMHLMGKRQLGQMQMSEFITAMIMSELASFTISDRNIPFIYGIIPLIAIITLEVICAYVSVKSSAAQRFLEGVPSALVKKGVIMQQEFINSRVTMKELLTELRISGLSSINEADYIFLEPNGKLSIIPKTAYRPVTISDMDLKVQDSGIDTSIIVDGKINDGGLSFAGKDRDWIKGVVGRTKISDIFYLSVNEAGKITIIMKDTLS